MNKYFYNKKLVELRDKYELSHKELCRLAICSENYMTIYLRNKRELTEDKYNIYKERIMDKVKKHNTKPFICSVGVFKGGVGKTSTVSNLAAEFGRRGNFCLVIDADSQADLSSSLIDMPSMLDKIEKNNFFNLLTSKEENEENIKDSIIHTDFANVDLLPSCISDESLSIERILAVSEHPERRLKYILDVIKKTKEYDYIFIDCNNQLGLLAGVIWECSDYLYSLCEPNYFNLKGCKIIYDKYKKVHKYSDNLEYLGIIMNKFRINTEVGQISYEQIKEEFSDLCFDSYIRTDEAINKAIFTIQPLMYFSKNNKAIEDYRHVASEMIERINKIEKQKEKRKER